MSRIIRESVLLGQREITIETGRMARQASGSVVVRCGDTMVLVTACGAKGRGLPFFPLTCNFEEKTYSAGKIPGGFFKREGRPHGKAILTSRLIDRPIRPLFPDGYREEVQVVATVLSMDGENDPDVLAITGASTALMLSDMPFTTPISGVRVGRVEGKLVANPTYAEREHSDVDIIMVASEEAIVMVEGEADEITEEDFLSVMDFAWKSVRDALALQRRMAEAVGKKKKTFESPKLDRSILNRLRDEGQRFRKALTIREKHARYAAVDVLKKELVAQVLDEFPEREDDIKACFNEVKSEVVRKMVTKERLRIDGRRLDEVRDISCEVGVLPCVHGSALFTRGETQALVALTLGTSRDEQRIDALEGEYTKRFMLHYNFPPFSVGEARPLRSPGRREIGHGMLAERALRPLVPLEEDDDFPYTVRLVSEILESNGSSSMASVCGGSLAFLDAGLELKKSVAGIAMGLVKEGSDVAVLSDILGDEDHLGDMDFKVCGTEDGITAIQMDTKIAGISREVMSQALEQARRGRIHILGEMEKALSEPRRDLSPYAPRIESLKINPDKIRDIIGAGGKTIRGIQAQTGASVNVEDDGTVTIATDKQESMKQALAIIKNITREAKVGDVHMGIVRRVVDFGAFIEIFPGTEGLCHISELTEGRVNEVTDVLDNGDEVLVKVIGVDRQGKVKLSRRAALTDDNKPSE